METRLTELENRVDELVSSIFIPLRRNEINEAAFNELFNTFEEAKKLLGESPQISRRLAGLVVFIYIQVQAQRRFSDADISAALLKKQSKIFKYLGQFLTLD